uniref:Uncharacterized protein n=1 Tax=Arundo donax TaxID=35708 RepID=A0A0A9C9Q3_ARUDO
MACGLFPSSGG